MLNLIKIFITLLSISILACLGLGWYFAAPAYKGATSDHFDGNRFHNKVDGEHGVWDFLKWLSKRKRGEWPKTRKNQAYKLPDQRLDKDRFRVTFINHSTLLIQIDGLNILTDPIWSERCSPLSFIGPKRVRLPGVLFVDLPPIDIILISHNHYDHLDEETLQRLWVRDRPRIFTGLGNKALLAKYGIESIELDWWQSVALGNKVKLWATPAQHFSNRGLSDRNKTLWLGFMIEAPDAKIYFAGDTGFGPHFQDIYDRFGQVDLALLPIGAFVPTWFMHFVHLSPEEALKAAEVLGAKNSIGIHFGTFALADDAEDEPTRELAKAKALYGGNLHTLDFGEAEDFVKEKMRPRYTATE